MSEQTNTETDRPFYIIFSNRTLSNISELINDYYEKCKPEYEDLRNFCLIVPDKFNGNITNRTIVVIDERIFDALKNNEHDLDNFNIQKLQYRKHFYPNAEKKDTYNLHVKLPKNLSLNACQTHLMERMTCLRTFQIWNKSDYTIYYPNMNRDQNKHEGSAYIYFNNIKEEKHNDVVLTRIFINNTKWPETALDVACMWARTKEDREKNSTQVTSVVKTGTVWDEKNGNHK